MAEPLAAAPSPEKKLSGPEKPAEKPSPEEGEKEKLRQLNVISLWLDDYNDIFSDFDSRPLAQRLISQDFLKEAKRASQEKPSGAVELILSLPETKRVPGQEGVIKKRLRDHFKRQFKLTGEKVKKTYLQGFAFIFAGVILMFAATWLLFTQAEADFMATFFVIFLEPAGWFFFWEGLHLVVFEAIALKPGLDFLGKMAKCDVKFVSY